jgi:PAS domain S-box-containing protein
MDQLFQFFSKLFDSSDWPPRWHCGKWSEFHGWLYIISDLLIWSAYFTIPVVILKYISKKQDIKFVRLYFLFAAFILACGSTHFLDAVAFWIPVYRLNALVRFITGILSWITVFYLVKLLPSAFSLKSQAALELEIEQRKKAEEQFQQLTTDLDNRIKERTTELSHYKYALDESSIVAITDHKGIIKHVNDNFCKISKYSREELIGQDHRIINSGYHSKEFIGNIWDTIVSGKIWKGELKNRAKDGTTYWVDTTIVPFLTTEGEPHQYIAIRADITKRKKSEEQQALLASIINFSDDAIISTDLDTNITSWNKGAANLFGYSGAEVLGEKVSMLIPSYLLNEESIIINKIAQGEYVKHYETAWMSKGGVIISISLSATPIRDSGMNIIGASQIIRNITDRKNAQRIQYELEEKVKKTSKELTGIFERITDGFIVLDKNFCYTYANRRIEEMMGRAPGSLIGKSVWSEFPEVIDTPVYHTFLNAMSQQKYSSNIDYFPFLDLWLENYVYPSAEGLSVFIKDITEQKKGEIKIRQSEKIYKTIASSIPGSVICLFDADYRYLLIEGDMLEDLGYKKEDILGRRVQDVVSAERFAEIAVDFERVYRGETFSTERRIMEFDVISRYVPLKDENNLVCNAIIFLIDVTQLKNAQRHIIKLNTSLEHKVEERTEQLASVNRELEAFSYSVSHDLRAPLRGIIGFTTILEEDHGSKMDQEAKRVLAVIKNNTLKMGRLIDDLLDFFRIGRQALSKTGIYTQLMVSEVIEELAHLNKGKEIEWEVHALPLINGNANTMRQVWVNLISNAIKYSSKKERPHIEIGSFMDNGQTTFFIKDNGVGFDNKYKDKLFNVFQRLHGVNEFEGTGVGLALVARIVSKHGGRVWGEGEIDKGACFYFSVPVTIEEFSRELETVK